MKEKSKKDNTKNRSFYNLYKQYPKIIVKRVITSNLLSPATSPSKYLAKLI